MFLFGIKMSPVVRGIIGIIVLVLALVMHSELVAVVGGVFLVWAAGQFFYKSRRRMQ
jgi:hypothetical protein